MHQDQLLSISSPARHAKASTHAQGYAQGYALAHAYPYVQGYALALARALIKAEHFWQVRTITTS